MQGGMRIFKVRKTPLSLTIITWANVNNGKLMIKMRENYVNFEVEGLKVKKK